MSRAARERVTSVAERPRIFPYPRRTTHARVVIRPGMHFDELLQTMAAVSSGDLRPGTLRRLASLLREHGCI